MKTNVLYLEDCKITMRRMPEASLEFIVTDPPYLLQFMSKKFDSQHSEYEGENEGQKMQKWHTEWLIEAYRVLKPGGFLVAFGGTRTYHRLACAMEDVGFEIRDTLMWLYGSGFPKSLDISKAIDKKGGKSLGKDVAGLVKKRRIELGYSITKLAELGNFYGEINHGGTVSNWETGKGEITIEQYNKLIEILKLNGEPIIEVEREVVRKRNLPSGCGFSGSRYGESKIIEYNDTIPKTEEAKKWDGWGTALKPAYEPIVIGMKPVDGSFVDNALNEGVAGINIDASRVATDSKIDDMLRITIRQERQSGQLWKEGSGFKNENNDYSGVRSDGRFPANVILQHHPECVKVGTKKVKVHKGYVGEQNQIPGGSGKTMGKGWHGKRIIVAHSDKDGMETIEDYECHEDCPIRIMNEQSGILETHGTGKNPKMSNIGFGSNRRKVDFQEYKSDSGGAARFFYTAKASKSERNLGLEGLPLGEPLGSKRSAPVVGRKSALGQSRENFHPTCKPIAIMHYLVNMFSTPDGGIVYDPFTGSGTTLIACKILGREYIGSEMEPEYYEIAKKRLEYDWETWWARGKKDDFVKVKEEVKNKFFE